MATLALGLGFGEVVVRAIGSVDSAGNFVFKNRIIKPHNLPWREVAASVRELQASSTSVIMYDEYLGWTHRPGSRSRDGLYQFNSQGIRSPVPAYADRPDSGVLRIALFGDSFTHSDDVVYEDSFGARLEAGLRTAGVRAEVLNFGVGGYGIDQAMLRYLVQGRALKPDLVVLGFQPEDLKRNLNLLRPLYDPRTRLPFAKPRFIFEGDGISLINVPVLPPDQVAGVLRDLDHWELLPHEYFYDAADYRRVWWRYSRLLATLADLGAGPDESYLLKRVLYRDGSEAQRLGWAVIRSFAQEVEANGAGFMIVHLPTVGDLEVRQRAGRWPYQAFLGALKDQYDVADPGDRLLSAIMEQGVAAVFAGHYTSLGNRIVAETVGAAIAREEAGTARPSVPAE